MRWLQLIPHLDPFAVMAAAALLWFAVGMGVTVARNVLRDWRRGRVQAGEGGGLGGEHQRERDAHPQPPVSPPE